MIYRIAYQYTGNFSDAEDILQDVSMALVTQKETLVELSAAYVLFSVFGYST